MAKVELGLGRGKKIHDKRRPSEAGTRCARPSARRASASVGGRTLAISEFKKVHLLAHRSVQAELLAALQRLGVLDVSASSVLPVPGGRARPSATSRRGWAG